MCPEAVLTPSSGMVGLLPPHPCPDHEAGEPCAQINCSSNRLQQLPRGLQGASALLSLDAAHNALFDLQPALSSAWAQLTSLSISHNRLRALPEIMSGLGRSVSEMPQMIL